MADNEFSCYGGRPRLQCGISGDDDDRKVAHMEEVAKRRGWEKFNWRDILKPNTNALAVAPVITYKKR